MELGARDRLCKVVWLCRARRRWPRPLAPVVAVDCPPSLSHRTRVGRTDRHRCRPLPSKEDASRSARRGAVEVDPTKNHEDVGLILGLTQWVKNLVLP